jgi:hypothetical protein
VWAIRALETKVRHRAQTATAKDVMAKMKRATTSFRPTSPQRPRVPGPMGRKTTQWKTKPKVIRR